MQNVFEKNRTFCTMLETKKESKCRCRKIESASLEEAKVQLKTYAILAQKNASDWMR